MGFKLQQKIQRMQEDVGYGKDIFQIFEIIVFFKLEINVPFVWIWINFGVLTGSIKQ